MRFKRRPSNRKPKTTEECAATDPESLNPAMLSKSQFSAALRRERRRTERSERPFLLMFADLGTLAARNNGRDYPEYLAFALARAARETDIVGWHRQNEVLGVIFTELGTNDKSAILACLKQKVTAVINECLEVQDAREVSLSFQFFPEDSSGKEEAISLNAELYSEHRPRPVARTLKRMIDVTGSALALIVLSPMLVAISLLIKLTSKGPVLFRQPRVGQHGKKFTILKFRTMDVDSDVTLHKEYVSQFIAGRALQNKSADGKASAYKVIDDPRVTPLGRFLRKTSLDEFPQLINVLKGELSLVGSRPPIPYELACYHLWHLRRIMEIKPGITGLWQVCGRSKTSFDEMVRLDLRYATTWSLWLDFVILLKTPGVVFSGDGAY